MDNGVDGIWLEGEHGGVTPYELGNLTRVCDLWGLTSVVRVNRNDQALVYRTLDRGAQGIVVPHVNTREEAENVVKGGKFAPIGQRGMFMSRQGYGVPDYFAKANDETLLVVLIEDIEAVRNLDEILKVEHIDVFFVAPSDLATSMGFIGNVDHPEVQDVITNTLRRISESGRTAGTLTTNDTVAWAVKSGARLLFTTVTQWIAEGAREFAGRASSKYAE